MSKHAMVIMKFCYSLAKCLKGKNGNPKRSPALFFCLLSFVFCLLFSAPAYAALSVDITTGGNWAIGAIKSSGVIETTDDTWIITNDGDESSDIYIKVDGTTWNPGSAAAAETFILKHDASESWSDAIINTGNGIVLTSSLAVSGTKPFDLQFTAPTSSAVEGTQQTLTVTLTAAAASGPWSCGLSILYEGKTYNTVLIGTQCWMQENLNVGTMVTGVTEQTSNATIEKYCYNDTEANCTSDGGLYQWDEAMQYVTTEGTQGLCPSGWHIPTDAEQHTLDNLYDSGTCDSGRFTWGCDPAGTHLSTLTLNGDNTSGFTALLPGYRHTDGSFYNLNSITHFWSSSETDPSAWRRYLDSGFSTVNRFYPNKAYGFSVRCLKDWSCGDDITSSYVADVTPNISPFNTASITYGTIESTLSGDSKCWITQNLGATTQAASATDTNYEAAGWYWQFNRKQGYYQPNANDALISTATPSTWDDSEDDTACDPVVAGTEWCPANDPCTLLLGTGWRLPTSTEWTNADGATGGNWDNYTDTYNSVLKLHAAGYLLNLNGSLTNRGSYGNYWSSTQFDSTLGYYLEFYSDVSGVTLMYKAYGFSGRCLKDEDEEWACGDNLAITHTAGTPNAEGNVAPVTKSVTYGTVETALTGESKCWITQNLGATDQASSATDSDEDSAGWYWQFNLEQGYKHDGTTLTPSWTIGSIDNDSDWIAANDPCTIELGAGWRLPTSAEWTNADGASGGNWDNYTDTYNSVLKIHAAGYLISDGLLYYRGSDGLYWSSAQFSSTAGYFLFFDSTDSYLEYFNKAYGYSVRCLKE